MDEIKMADFYDPNRLLDTLVNRMRLKNDAALSRALEVPPPVISKIRHRTLPVGAAMLVRIHDVSGLSIRDIKLLMGDRRSKHRHGKRLTHEINGRPLAASDVSVHTSI